MDEKIKPDLDTLERDLGQRIAAAESEADLEAARVAALGRKGVVSDLLKGLGAMSPVERQTMGPALNGLKGGQVRSSALRKVILEIYAMLEADEAEVA